MARIGVGATAVLLLMLLVYGCGGESATTTLIQEDDSTTAPEDAGTTATEPVATTSAPDTTSPEGNPSEPTIPADFPVPICGISSGPCEGGTVHSAFGSEVIVIYPETEYEALLDYYQTISDANEGTRFDLFPEGSEWEVEGIQIRVTPVDSQTEPQLPPGIQLFVRLSP